MKLQRQCAIDAKMREQASEPKRICVEAESLKFQKAANATNEMKR